MLGRLNLNVWCWTQKKQTIEKNNYNNDDNNHKKNVILIISTIKATIKWQTKKHEDCCEKLPRSIDAVHRGSVWLKQTWKFKLIVKKSHVLTNQIQDKGSSCNWAIHEDGKRNTDIKAKTIIKWRLTIALTIQIWLLLPSPSTHNWYNDKTQQNKEESTNGNYKPGFFYDFHYSWFSIFFALWSSFSIVWKFLFAIPTSFISVFVDFFPIISVRFCCNESEVANKKLRATSVKLWGFVADFLHLIVK